MLILVLGLGVTMTVLFLAFGIEWVRDGNAAERRLSELGDGGRSASEALTAPVASGQRPVSPFLNKLSEIVTPLSRNVDEMGGGAYDHARKRLAAAGLRSSNSLAVYLGGRVALSMVFALLVVFMCGVMRTRPQVTLMLVPLGAMTGYVILGIAVDAMGQKRREAIRRGLADAIDLMVICVESGLPLLPTMRRVATELERTNPIISAEFETTVRETEAGRSLMDAFRGMADRADCRELSLFVSLLVQTDRFGTPVVDMLTTQAEAMRFERMQYAEAEAQKAPARMIMPSALIFLAIVFVMAGPPFLALLTSLAR